MAATTNNAFAGAREAQPQTANVNEFLGPPTTSDTMDADNSMTEEMRDPVKVMGSVALGGFAFGYYAKTKRKTTQQWAAWSVAIFAAVLAFLAYQQQQSALMAATEDPGA